MLETIHLSLPAATDDLRKLQIGTVAYLSGRIFTAREGVYKRAIEDGAGMPAARDALGLANFHCSPAATVNADGSYTVGAVTATASFRFAQWLDGWFELSGCNIIIGKGGMTSEVYRQSFVPNNAVYLTTVGYGTGALLGRGIKRVAGVYWVEELGLAQAVWVLDVDKFGPFLVESDLAGNSLFERENAKIAPGLAKLYAGTKPPPQSVAVPGQRCHSASLRALAPVFDGLWTRVTALMARLCCALHRIRDTQASDAFGALFTFQTAHLVPAAHFCVRGFATSLHRPRIEGWAERRETFGCSAEHPWGVHITRYARRLARRLASHDAGRSPLGAPPRRFWASGPRFSHRHPPLLTLRRASDRAQRAPRSQVVVPGGRGPRASRGERLRAATAGRHSPLRLQDR